MGSILARFKKKKNTKEILESLENNILYIENMTSNTSPINYYKIIFHSALLYGLISILYYFGILSHNIFENKYITAALAAYPIVALYYYKIDVWYNNRKLTTYKNKLTELRSEKKKILDEVMEKETFKVAKEILEKYDPRQLQSMTSQNFMNHKTLQSTNNIKQFSSSGRPVNRITNMVQPPAIMSSTVRPKLTLPRPILSKDRTIFDRVADIVLGDGPQNRYALICRTCGSHNGMARKEEFDYLAYRCAYCSQWNPSLKPRPQLAISYDKIALTQDNCVTVTSTETIEEITDEVSLKTDLDTNESDSSEPKDDLINKNLNSDYLGPTIEELDDTDLSNDPNSIHKEI